MLKRKNILIGIAAVVVLLVAALIIANKFVFNKKIELKKEKAGNINVLLLGRGGGTHEGPDLTDTIILAMINPSKNRADLISVPRDLWVTEIKGKINKAYSIGQGNNNQGLLLTRAVVEKVTGQNIDYVVVLDFSAFVETIDYLGGIDVDVSRTLDDYSYPIEGKEQDPCDHTEDEIASLSAEIATGSAKENEAFPCRYKHLHFDIGVQHMNGQQALEFSRSRHGINGEGGDFSRSKRQQEVINAVKAKALSLGIILNPIKVIGLFNIIRDNLDTNIQVGQFDDFINLAQDMQDTRISNYVLDYGNENIERYGLLTEPVRTADKGYQSILIPRAGENNYSEIHEYIKCIADGLVCDVGEDRIIKRTSLE